MWVGEELKIKMLTLKNPKFRQKNCPTKDLTAQSASQSFPICRLEPTNANLQRPQSNKAGRVIAPEMAAFRLENRCQQLISVNVCFPTWPSQMPR